MEDFEAFREALFAPPQGTDPDHVSEQVVQDELVAFQALAAQTR